SGIACAAATFAAPLARPATARTRPVRARPARRAFSTARRSVRRSTRSARGTRGARRSSVAPHGARPDGATNQTVKSRLLLALAVASCAGASPQPPVRPTAAPVAFRLDAIRPERISADVRFLADDALEGRAPGERGYVVASRYVAAELAALGAEAR